MRAQNIASFGFVSLLIFAAACSIDSGEERPDDQSPAMARLENCEVSEEMATRIREVEQRINELRRRYTEQHPEVIGARRVLDDLVQAALSECVEQLQ